MDQPTLEASYTHDRFVAMFLMQNRRAQAGLLIACLVIAVFWYYRVRSPEVFAWLGVAVLICVSRFLWTETYVNEAQSQSQSTRRIALLLFFNGILLILPLLDFAQFSASERFAVSIVLLASATASAATTNGYRKVFLAFAATMLVPLALAWMLAPALGEATWEKSALALLILVYLAFLVSVAQQANQVVEDSSRFRYAELQSKHALEKALTRASESERAKAQFLAAASHDLRQPIHSLTLLVAALGLGDLDAKSRAIVRLMDSVNQSLGSQLTTLLDISRLDAGVVAPDMRPNDLSQLLLAHAAALGPVAQARNVQLNVAVEEGLFVQSDESLLVRLISNLTDNAIKFTNREGTVQIRAARAFDLVVVSVTDTGIGMPDHEHERVFSEFYQINNLNRDRTMGLGLGLSIVKRLATLLHIDLAMQSQLGVGTSFTLRLPALERHTQRSALVPKGKPVFTRRVLVVDDESVIRESMSMLLDGLGCHAVAVATRSEAEAALSATSFDLILCDLQLGHGDTGAHVAAAAARIQPRARFVLVTGDTSRERLQAAQAITPDVLHKPVQLEELMRVLFVPGVDEL